MIDYEECIHVIVPFYNAARWIERCLLSVASQRVGGGYTMRVHVVDDASTDGSSDIARELCRDLPFNYHRNERNIKCPQNIQHAILRSESRPWDVIFLLDGDDYIPHGGVLERVSQIFAEEATWLTYGQYMSDPPHFGCSPARDFDYETIAKRDFRKKTAEEQYFNHPLIFRRFLFDAIPIQQMKHGAAWFKTGYDRVLMVPMLELATPWGADDYPSRRWRFINEIFYAYNSTNDNSEAVVNPGANVDEIYDRPVLPPISRRMRRG